MRRATLFCLVVALFAACTIEVPVGTSGPLSVRERPEASMTPSAATTNQSALGAGASEDTARQGAAGTLSTASASDATTSDPSRTASAGDDWPTFGRTFEHTGASDEDSGLTPSSPLEPLWNRSSAAVTATPAIFDGIAYWGDWSGVVHAADLEDGHEIWRHELAAGVVSSAFVNDDSVYIADREGSVYALARATGELQWRNTLSTHVLTRVWSSPVVVDGHVILGLSTADPPAGTTAAPFIVVALDAMSGQTLWTSEVREAQAAAAAAPRPAGLSMWSTAAIDETREFAILCAGRGDAPLVGWDVMVGLDYRTGETRYVSALEEPLLSAPSVADGAPFDSDGTFHPDAAPLLFSATVEGRALDLVGVPSRSGAFRAHNREDGQTVWASAVRDESGIGPVAAPDAVSGAMIPAAYADGRVFTGYSAFPDTTRLVALDAATGMPVWTYTLERAFALGGLSTVNGVLFATAAHFDEPGGPWGSLWVLNADNGEQTQGYGTVALGGVAGGIALSGNLLVFGSGFSFQANAPQEGGISVLSY